MERLRLAFGHWLVRQVGYEALMISERQPAHRRTAEAIEASRSPGAPPNDDELASAVASDPVEFAAARDVPEELAGHWEHAGRRRRAASFALAAAGGRDLHGHLAEGLRAAISAARLAALGADGPLRGAAEALRGRLLGRASRYNEARTAFALARDALASAGENPSATRILARVLGGEAEILHSTSRFVEAEAGFRAALEHARAAGAAREEAYACHGIGSATMRQGRYAEALPWLHRAAETMRAAGDLRGESSVHNSIGVAVGEMGDYAGAYQSHLRSIETDRRIGNQHGIAVGLVNVGALLFSWGRFEEARRSYEECLAVVARVGAPLIHGRCLGNLGQVDYAVGDLARAEARLREALERQLAIGDRVGAATTRLALGSLCCDDGRPAEGLSLLEELVTTCRRDELPDALPFALATFAIQLDEAGQREHAAVAADEALAIARRLGSDEVSMGAEVAWARAHDDDDAARSAVELARKVGNPLSVFEALLGVASVERRAGRHESSAEALREAAELARQHGMAGHLRRCEARATAGRG